MDSILVKIRYPIINKTVKNIKNLLTSFNAKLNTFFLPLSVDSTSDISLLLFVSSFANRRHTFHKPVHIILKILIAYNFLIAAAKIAVSVEYFTLKNLPPII